MGEKEKKENDEEQPFMALYREICRFWSKERTFRNSSNFGNILVHTNSITFPYRDDIYTKKYLEIWNHLNRNASLYLEYKISRDIYLNTLYSLLNDWLSEITSLLERKHLILENEVDD